MATESPLLHDGSQTITSQDMRNSTVTGTTLSGPNGSGQFLGVCLSTTVARTIALATAAGQRLYGIIQNKPSTGLAADVGVFGISKWVAGATIGIGGVLQVSSTAAGTAIPYASAAGIYPAGVALESAVVGQVFTAAIYGFGGMPSGI